MKILYLDAEEVCTDREHGVGSGGDDVTCVTNSRDALKKIAAERFDAVVIADDGPDTIEFTMNARRMRPYLLLFVASVWGPVDLPVALASVRGVCDRISRNSFN